MLPYLFRNQTGYCNRKICGFLPFYIFLLYIKEPNLNQPKKNYPYYNTKKKMMNYKKTINFIKSHSIIFLLGFLWFIVQLLFFIQNGIFVKLEAAKYINQANILLHTGNLSAPNLWFYSTEIFLIALSIKMKLGYYFVYLIQLCVNLIATFNFYNLSKKYSSTNTAFITTTLLIFTLPLQELNSFLQTESLYTSFTIIFMSLILQKNSFSLWKLTLILAFLLLICVTRPTGLLMIPSTVLLLSISFATESRVKYFLLAFGIIVFLVVINYALGRGGEWRFMLAFQKELVLCESTPYFTNIKMSDNPNSVFGFAYYITHNFDQFSRLAWLKTKAFWGLKRDYFSNAHNAYLMIYFFPVYILCLSGFRWWILNYKRSFLFLILNVLLVWFTVVLTCDDWHNRFFLVMTPYLYLLSIPGLNKLKKFMRSLFLIKWTRLNK